MSWPFNAGPNGDRICIAGCTVDLGPLLYVEPRLMLRPSYEELMSSFTEIYYILHQAYGYNLSYGVIQFLKFFEKFRTHACSSTAMVSLKQNKRSVLCRQEFRNCPATIPLRMSPYPSQGESVTSLRYYIVFR